MADTNAKKHLLMVEKNTKSNLSKLNTLSSLQEETLPVLVVLTDSKNTLTQSLSTLDRCGKKTQQQIKAHKLYYSH